MFNSVTVCSWDLTKMYEFSSSIQTCGCQNVGSNLCDFYSQRPYATSLPVSGQIIEMEGKFYPNLLKLRYVKKKIILNLN